MNEQKALIKGNWVVCPICGKKQFMITGNEVIHNLLYRCKNSCSKYEHFMIVEVKEGKVV